MVKQIKRFWDNFSYMERFAMAITSCSVITWFAIFYFSAQQAIADVSTLLAWKGQNAESINRINGEVIRIGQEVHDIHTYLMPGKK